MSRSVVKVHPVTDLLNMPLFAKVEQSLDAVRKRAHEIFQARGHWHGMDIEDWLAAERELFLQPESELKETETGFELTMKAPGFDPAALQVAVEPGSVSVQAESEEKGDGEYSAKCLFRHYQLFPAINPDAVKASWEHGTLTVILPKASAGKPEEPKQEPAKKEMPKAMEIPVKSAAA